MKHLISKRSFSLFLGLGMGAIAIGSPGQAIDIPRDFKGSPNAEVQDGRLDAVRDALGPQAVALGTSTLNSWSQQAELNAARGDGNFTDSGQSLGNRTSRSAAILSVLRRGKAATKPTWH